MTYIKSTSKSVEQAAQDVEEVAKGHGFGVLHTYDFKATLHSKGFEIPSECRVLEICNPQIASEILTGHIEVNLALPCRVSVYEEGGQTKIGMIPPTAMLGLICDSPELQQAARGVEETMVTIIKESL